MEKIIPNVEPASATQLLSQLPLVQGAIAGQRAINQEMEEMKEEAKVQGEAVFGSLYDRVATVKSVRDAPRLPALDDEADEEQTEFQASDDEEQPLVQQPQIRIPMGGLANAPQEYIDMMDRHRQGLQAYQEQRQRDIDEVAQRIEPDTERRRTASEFAVDLLRTATQQGITFDRVVRTGDFLTGLYHVYQENKMPTFDIGQTPDPSVEPNLQRQKFFEENAVPTHCKRRLYTDASGVLRSIVTCEASGDQRIYHDK